jgi:hypothetical protein
LPLLLLLPPLLPPLLLPLLLLLFDLLVLLWLASPSLLPFPRNSSPLPLLVLLSCEFHPDRLLELRQQSIPDYFLTIKQKHLTHCILLRLLYVTNRLRRWQLQPTKVGAKVVHDGKEVVVRAGCIGDSSNGMGGAGKVMEQQAHT